MRKGRLLWFAVLFFSGGAVFAQCGNPAGVAGQQKYNVAAIPNTMSVCNGTNWVSLSTAPGGSGGYVQFNNSGSFGGDSSLFWDNTNKRLGIGTAAPASSVSVLNGDIRIFTTTGSRGIIFQDGTVKTTATGDARIITGTYTGDGTASQTITLGFRPKLVIVKSVNGTYDGQGIAIDGIPDSATQLYSYNNVNYPMAARVVPTDTGFTAYGTANDAQFNASAAVYYFVALGLR
ncbi:MAG: hypothetical protein PHP45_03610 [Elusimicrobiales bacterium]|nr:hypothetical protein [Elusimicrobiales bacterium]